MDFTGQIVTRPGTPLGARLRALAYRRRTRRLTSQRSRRRLGENLEHVVHAAEIPQAMRGSAVPVNRDEILRCRPLLRGLADELEGDYPVTRRGLVMLQELLRDGASPIYAGSTQGALEQALTHVRAALLLQ